jgi:hypothetical protein
MNPIGKVAPKKSGELNQEDRRVLARLSNVSLALVIVSLVLTLGGFVLYQNVSQLQNQVLENRALSCENLMVNHPATPLGGLCSNPQVIKYLPTPPK